MPGAIRLVPNAGETFVVQPGRSVTIGRRKGCDLVLPDAGISRQHCRLEVIAGTWRATDLDSSNGTFLNGQRVTAAELKNGDELRIGPVAFVVSIDEAVAVGAPAAAARLPEPPPAPAVARPPHAAPRQPAPAAKPKAPTAEPRPGSRSRRLRRLQGDAEADTSASSRRSGRSSSRQNPLPYYAAGGSLGILVLVLVIATLLSGNSEPRQTKKRQPAREPSVQAVQSHQRSSSSEVEEARQQYKQCAELMGRKDYANAVALVNRTHELHLQLLNRYPEDPELMYHTEQLSKWVRQLGHWADARSR